MIVEFPPGLLMIVGAIFAPFVRGHLRSAYMLALPLLGLWQLMSLDLGSFGAMSVFGFELTHVRIDKLSLIFGYIFYIAAAISIIFAWQNEDLAEQASALVYVGAAVGATFAGDLITLFVYWELAALSSVFLIWAGRTERAYSAGMRYLLIQIFSGVLLAAGAVLRANDSGSVAFDKIGVDSLGGVLILIAFGIKCAFPLLHNWLQDAYPEASPTGTVFLSAFTTKLAVYALARGYAGTEILIWIGVAMTAFPIFFAVIENDLRRVLAYSLASAPPWPSTARSATPSPIFSIRRFCSCPWERCCTAWARSKARNWAGFTKPCLGRPASVSSARPRSPPFPCSAALSPNR